MNDTPQVHGERADRFMYCLSALADMGETIAGVRSIQRSAREVLHIVLGTMGSSKGALLTLDGGRFTVTAARGTKTGVTLPADKQLVRVLETSGPTVLPRWNAEFPARLKALCNRRLSALQTVIAVVLRAQRAGIGVTDVLAGHSQHAASNVMRIAAAIQHASEPIQRRVGVRAPD